MKFIQESLKNMENMAKDKHLTMKEACRMAQINPSTVSRWLNKKESPRMQLFENLYEAIKNYEAPKS